LSIGTAIAPGLRPEALLARVLKKTAIVIDHNLLYDNKTTQLTKTNLTVQWRRGTNVLRGGQGQYFSDKPKNFPDKPKSFPDNILTPPPVSTTLTISDNIDNFPTGLNNRGGGMAPLPPPATAPLDIPHVGCENSGYPGISRRRLCLNKLAHYVLSNNKQPWDCLLLFHNLTILTCLNMIQTDVSLSHNQAVNLVVKLHKMILKGSRYQRKESHGWP
jgi:hypothetical protein